jgi:hypothetical protein
MPSQDVRRQCKGVWFTRLQTLIEEQLMLRPSTVHGLQHDIRPYISGTPSIRAIHAALFISLGKGVVHSKFNSVLNTHIWTFAVV